MQRYASVPTWKAADVGGRWQGAGYGNCEHRRSPLPARIELNGLSVADCLRGAADWLDQAEQQLGKVLFVSDVRFDHDDDEGFRISLFVYEDEVVEPA